MAADLKPSKGLGLDMFHVAKLQTDVAGTPPTYATPTALPEALKISIKPQSDVAKFYADNAVSEINSRTIGVQIDLGIGGLSQANEQLIMGMEAPGESEIGILGDMLKMPAPVAFGYRRMMSGKTSAGKQRYRYVWLYKITFTPSDENAETMGDKTQYQTPTLSGECAPLDAFQPGQQYWRYTYDNWESYASDALETAFFTTVHGWPVSGA